MSRIYHHTPHSTKLLKEGSLEIPPNNTIGSLATTGEIRLVVGDSMSNVTLVLSAKELKELQEKIFNSFKNVEDVVDMIKV